MGLIDMHQPVLSTVQIALTGPPAAATLEWRLYMNRVSLSFMLLPGIIKSSPAVALGGWHTPASGKPVLASFLCTDNGFVPRLL